MDKQQLKLATALKFWFQYQPSKDNFNQSLIPIAVVNSVEKFWSVYQHCKRPSTLDDNSYFYIFKENVKPVWEDPNNEHGGAFLLRFEKDKGDKVWEDLVLAFVAENVGQEFPLANGLRFKIRKDMQIAEVWVSDAEDEQKLQKVREWVIKATCLNPDSQIQVIKFQVE